MKWWKAHAHDWVFCRQYSYYHTVSGGVNPFRAPVSGVKTVASLLGTAGVAAILFYLYQSRGQTIFGILGNVSIAVLVLQFMIAGVKHVTRQERAAGYPPVDSTVPYVQISNTGIRVNWTHQSKEEDMPFIRWDQLKGIELMFTEHRDRIRQGSADHHYMKTTEARFKHIKAQDPAFPYKAEKIYTDRLSLLLHHNPAFLSQIPIPPAWDGEQIQHFLEQTEQASGLRIERYRYGGEERAQAFEAQLSRLDL